MLEDKLANLDEFTGLVFGGEVSVDELAAPYSRRELLDFLKKSVAELRETVVNMTQAELAYRIPGAPTGPDESGDEEHFDTSQIVTHVASGLSFHRWHIARALGHERPDFPRPPEGTPTTGKKKNAMGGGGWSGLSGQELARLLDDALAAFLGYVETLPLDFDPEANSRHVIFGHLSPHGWLFLGSVHPAMHVKQIEKMQAQEDYPRA